MKIFLTGHKGFIGSSLLGALDHHDITTYDISDNYVITPESLDLDEYDWVIHLGAYSSTTETNTKKVLDNNLTWSARLFEQCIKSKTNFQWASSASVYGNRKGSFSEDDTPQPNSLYATSKYLLEQYIIKRNPTNIIYQGFRYFNVYGDNEEHKIGQASPQYTFRKQAITNGVIQVFKGSENYKRDFVPVEYVVSVHKRFFDIAKSGIWNVGTGTATSFLDVANEIAYKYNASIQEIDFPQHLKENYQKYTCASTTKLNKELKTREPQKRD